ncbi:putative uncharacterized protein DDB_G0284097 [Amphibalanus amphitrite]|uniref:putative uncharacterized protein DDB_G0284097 n=1 Tax=Amphibalanus amphitrite TaxID=1232801 RepID=UPI001C901324|nr:putative uncharacterized protein DDB_G0284097 [Amphibalanus amphitrite]
MRSLSMLLAVALVGVALSQNFRGFRPPRFFRNFGRQEFRPQQQQFRPQQQQQFRQQQQRPQQQQTQTGGNGLWLSWENKPGKFTWGEADATCRGLGLQLVSLDSPGKNNNINGLIGSNNIEYIWTSGRRSGGNNFVWGNGQRVGNYGWGQTGGNRRPQPDNRAGGEDCLAVLNRFYPGDGITWHDVQCHHKKPFICE